MPERLVPLACQRIAERTLSARLPEKTFGGVSGGRTCSLCSEPIERNSLEIEAESRGVPLLFFHPLCYAAWTTAIRQDLAVAPQHVT
jgi:hypothetical protein